MPLVKRADTNVPLLNVSVISYLIEMSVGTPGQKTKVAIDTGSDELWVNPQCSTASTSSQRAECNANGQYKPGSSSTSVVSQATERIPYGKGEVTIQYVKDSISLPESTISMTDVIFGVGLKSTDLSEGILGLGYGNGINLQYDSFVDNLFKQNVTQSRAFSIALGSADANNGGVIIFGGVDTSKFSGPLTPVPILGPQGKEKIRRYWVQLDSIGSTAQGGASKSYTGSQIPIVIDSGSSLSYLPRAVIEQMANDTNAKYSQADEVYLVPCSQRSSSSTFDFTFGGNGTAGSAGVKIPIPYSQFIWQAGPNDCVLGALPLTGGSDITALLGDTFMRSVVAVFNQQANTVSLAPYANCGQTEKVIPADGATAQFTGECKPGQGATGSNNESSKKNSATPRAAAGVGAAAWLSAVAVVVVAQVLMGLAW